MTQEDMIIKQKLSLLNLARTMKSITKACNLLNVSRQHYYNVKSRFEKYGIDGLREIIRKSPKMPNQASIETESKVINFSLENPSFGSDRISLEIKMKGIQISSNGVRQIWKRNNLLKRKDRYLKLEENMRNKGFHLSDEQLNELVKNANMLKERHVISYYPGYMLCQDTYEVGYIKNVGKIYMQGVIDTYGSFAFAKLYTDKTSYSSANILEEQVIPFYYNQSIPILSILTDNGKEYCGNSKTHDYEILLNSVNIKHKKTKVRSPQTNGFIERFNRTISEEFFSKMFRVKFYVSIYDLQKDMNEWLIYYNFKRKHQGYRVKGRTPIEVLVDKTERIKQIELKK